MTETFTDNGALANWSLPQCPFGIEYSRKALDDIRLAVVDAFFSLPRGGAEIGGILLGRFDENRLQILDYAPIECEHAFGPAFTLSPADQTRLGEMMRQDYPGGLRPVGWYHSHTRSEISLCDADLDIHNRYFPEQWQVALVLRPSTLQPTQAGFFFRESDGSIQTRNSYQEFMLEALPVRLEGPEAVAGPMRETEPGAVVLTLPSAQTEEPAETVAESSHGAQEPAQPIALLPAPTEFPVAAEPPAPEAESQPEAAETFAEPVTDSAPEPLLAPFAETESESPLPHTSVHSFQFEAPHHEEYEPAETREPAATSPAFASAAEESAKPQRRWIGIAAGLVAGLTLGLFAGQARSHSRQAPAPAPAPVATPIPAPAPAAPSPDDAALRKQNDELTRQVADLSQQNTNLKKENADLANQHASLSKQDAELSKQQGDAGKRQAELRQQRDDLLKQTAKLKLDLTAQTAHAQALQQQVDDLRRQQQRRRLSIQSSDPLP